MTDATANFPDLNPQQHEAVYADDGPTLVLAGPGSGKTRVLTYRAAHLVADRAIEPWHVMAVTFTNKAAREMGTRLEALLGEAETRAMTLGTFHSTCARWLRIESDAIGLERNFVIFDSDDQLTAVRQALADLNLDDKTYRPVAVRAAISNAKNELIRAQDYQAPTYWHEVAGRVYRRYDEILRASNGLDFDDLLLEAAFLMRDDPEIRSKYQRKYRHVLVDEFQDTNSAQYVLLKALAGAADPDSPQNLFVVGDEDQSIYRWRGADYRNIDRFRRDFPNARTILLEQNYRSTQTILDAARAVIDVNTNRTPKELWTDSGRGSNLTLFEAYDEEEEAVYVVRCIESRVREGARYGDFAVMYRTNAQSRVLEDAFVRRSVPYQLVGATRFYERREIKDVLAYLRLVLNPRDEMSLRRVINVPGRGIGPRSMQILGEWADANACTRWDALELIASGERECDGASSVDTRTFRALCGFHEMMSGLLALRSASNTTELLDKVIERTGYMQYVRDGSEEGESRWENVLELRGVAVDFATLPPDDALAAMLESVALVSDVDSLENTTDRVTLLTLHSAKGLEYHTVFLTGLEEHILPHNRSMDDPEAMAEERRLFYVGLTRARSKAFIVHTHRRMVFGTYDTRDPSRFLGDLPPALLGDATASTRATAGGGQRTVVRTRARDVSWDAASGGRSEPGRSEPGRSEPGRSEPGVSATRSSVPRTAATSGSASRRSASGGSAPDPSAETGFRPGDKVSHAKFGDGVVVSSVAKDGDEEITVAFDGAGVKRLMQRYAKLSRR